MLKVIGDFWMEYGEIIVLTSAVVTLIGVVFTLFRNNSIANSTTDRVESKGNQLSGEHSRLSSEHSVQSVEHNSILEKVIDTKSEIGEVRKTVSDVNIRLIQADADNKLRFINLDDAQKKLCSSAEDIGKFSEEFMRLAAENKQLTEENKSLSRENADLIKQNTELIEYIRAERMQQSEAHEDYEPEM